MPSSGWAGTWPRTIHAAYGHWTGQEGRSVVRSVTDSSVGSCLGLFVRWSVRNSAVCRLSPVVCRLSTLSWPVPRLVRRMIHGTTASTTASTTCNTTVGQLRPCVPVSNQGPGIRAPQAGPGGRGWSVPDSQHRRRHPTAYCPRAAPCAAASGGRGPGSFLPSARHRAGHHRLERSSPARRRSSSSCRRCPRARPVAAPEAGLPVWRAMSRAADHSRDRERGICGWPA